MKPSVALIGQEVDLMVSQSAQYALRVVVHLASHSELPMTTVQLAAATHVPQFYLAKLMRTLVEAGLVSSRRGISGGFHLARDPASLSLLEVVQAVTTSLRSNRCLDDSTGEQRCSLHRRLHECRDYVERTLGASTIADMLEEDEELASQESNWQAALPLEVGHSH